MVSRTFVLGALVGLLVGCLVWDMTSENLLMRHSVVRIADWQKACGDSQQQGSDAPNEAAQAQASASPQLQQRLASVETQLADTNAKLEARNKEVSKAASAVATTKKALDDCQHKLSTATAAPIATATPTATTTTSEPCPSVPAATSTAAAEGCGAVPVDVAAVVAAANKVRSQIEEHWTVAPSREELLSEERFDVTNRDIIIKRLQRALVMQDGWFMAYVGTSVTAAHDNLYSQSYPFVVERRLRPIFEAANVPFKVVNYAMGNYGCLPSHLCFNDIVSERADYVSWEFEMMQCAGTAASMFARAMWSRPRQPILEFSWRTLRAYNKRYNFDYPIKQWRDAVPAAYGKDMPIMSSYVGKQVFQWTKDPANKKNWDFEVVMGYLPGPYKRKKTMGFAPWHPAPFGHEILGDVDAYYWAKLLLDAVQTLPSGTQPGQWPAPPRIPLPPDPSPWANVTPPVWTSRCYTDWQPTEHPLDISIWNALDDDRWKTMNGWKRLLRSNTVKVVTESEHKHCGYRDRKVDWMTLPGTTKSVPMGFQWEQKAQGPVMLCGEGNLFRNTTARSLYVKMVLDGKPIDVADPKQSPWDVSDGKAWSGRWPQLPVNTLTCGYPVASIPPGPHRLQVFVTAPAAGQPYEDLTISHFLHW